MREFAVTVEVEIHVQRPICKGSFTTDNTLNEETYLAHLLCFQN